MPPNRLCRGVCWLRQVKTVKLIDAPPVQMITDQMSMLTGVIGPPNLPISQSPAHPCRSDICVALPSWLTDSWSRPCFTADLCTNTRSEDMDMST